MRYNLIQVTTILVVYSIQISAVIPSDATVQTRNGYKTLQDLEVGERVTSINDRGDRLSRLAVMAKGGAIRRNSTVEVYSYDSKLKACADQSFYDPVKRKWVNAEDLNGENFILNDRLESVRVMGIKRKSGIPVMASAVTIARSHSLFVDGYLVHNSSDPGKAWKIGAAIGSGIGYVGRQVIEQVAVNYLVDRVGYASDHVYGAIQAPPSARMELVMQGVENERTPMALYDHNGNARARENAEAAAMAPVRHERVDRSRETRKEKYYRQKAEREAESAAFERDFERRVAESKIPSAYPRDLPDAPKPAPALTPVPASNPGVIGQQKLFVIQLSKPSAPEPAAPQPAAPVVVQVMPAEPASITPAIVGGAVAGVSSGVVSSLVLKRIIKRDKKEEEIKEGIEPLPMRTRIIRPAGAPAAERRRVVMSFKKDYVSEKWEADIPELFKPTKRA